MKMQTYEIKVAGLTRELELFAINDKMQIAGFIMFSDVELCKCCAKELIEKLSSLGIEYDIIITDEAKGIPIAYEMSSQSGRNYIVARKSVKLYMRDPVSVTVRSITTDAVQTLYLSQQDIDLIRGRRVLIVDDVISTGESIRAMEALIEKSGCKTVGKAAVLAEGSAAERDDIIFLEKLPLFDIEGNIIE